MSEFPLLFKDGNEMRIWGFANVIRLIGVSIMAGRKC